MNASKTCPICETELPPDAPGGVCPRCLLSAGLEGIAGNHLHVRCPHCRHAIEIVDQADEITCPSCDSRFNLLGDHTVPCDATGPSAIGRFELLGQIGIGAFGTVWRARDPELDRDVAIKIPRKEQLTLAETELFLREARSAAQLRHPHIVHVHEVGRDDGRIYIVSDLVEGMTLADRLTAGRPPFREAAELVRKLAGALAVAHAAGIVHRDLKPSNVLLDDLGEPHLTDFGLAKRDAGEITITIEGRVLGTPAYMSPEQARGDGHAADSRSDVYSLGVMLFELLTGEKPFRGNTTMLLHQVMHDEPPLPRRLDGTVPRDIETICLKCLEKDAARRFQTARELAADLDRFLADDPIHARPIGRLEHARRWCRKHKLVALLASAVVVSLIVGLATTLWQWRIASDNVDAAEAARIEEREQRELAVQRGEETQQALDGSQSRLSRLFAERGMRDLETDPHAGLPWLLAAYRTSPRGSGGASMHRLRLGLMIRNVPHFAGFWPEARTAACSRNGKLLAVAVGNEALVFELPSMRQVVRLQHEHEVIGLDFYPDGERLLTRCQDLSQNPGDAGPDPPMWGRVWNTRTAEPFGPPRQLNGPIVEDRGLSSFEALWAPDGKRLFVVNYGMMNRFYTRMTIRVFDAATLEPLGGEFAHHHKDEQFDYVISPACTHVLTLRGVPYTGKGESEEDWPTESSNPRIWDALSGEPVTERLSVPIAEYGHDPAEFSRDGTKVLIGGSDGAYLFEVSGKLLRRFPSDEDVRSVRFHPGGQHIVLTDATDVRVFDLETGEEQTKRRWQWRHSGMFELDPTGRWYAMGSGRLAEWPFGNNEANRDESLNDWEHLIFSGDGTRLLANRKNSARVRGRSEVLTTYDARRLTPLWRFDEGRQPDDRALSHDGRFFLRRDDAGVWLWDLDARPRLLRPFAPLEGAPIRDIAVHEQTSRMVVLTEQGDVSVWDSQSGTQLGSSFRPDGKWSRFVLDPSGGRIALIGNGPDAITEPSLEEEQFEIRNNGKVWESDREVCVWDLTTRQALTAPLPHRTVSEVRFTPDGERLVVVASFYLKEPRNDNKQRLRRSWPESELSVWNLADGRAIVGRRRSRGEISLEGFAADGSALTARVMRIDYLPNTLLPQTSEETVSWNTDDWRVLDSRQLDSRNDREVDQRNLDRSLVVKSEQGRLTVVDESTGRNVVELQGSVSSSIESWAVAPNGTAIAVVFEDPYWVSGDSQIRQWNLLTGEQLASPMSEPRVTTNPILAYRPDGRVLAIADDDELRLWDAGSSLPLTEPLPFVAGESSSRALRSLWFTTGGKRLYVARGDSIWVLPLADLLAEIPPDEELVRWSRVLSAHYVDEAGGYVPLADTEVGELASELLSPFRSRMSQESPQSEQ